jgi:hypothetical protein
VRDESIFDCRDEAGFFFPFANETRNASHTGVCKSAACKALMPLIENTTRPDCAFRKNGWTFNIHNIAQDTKTKCRGVEGSLWGQ